MLRLCCAACMHAAHAGMTQVPVAASRDLHGVGNFSGVLDLTITGPVDRAFSRPADGSHPGGLHVFWGGGTPGVCMLGARLAKPYRVLNVSSVTLTAAARGVCRSLCTADAHSGCAALICQIRSGSGWGCSATTAAGDPASRSSIEVKWKHYDCGWLGQTVSGKP